MRDARNVRLAILALLAAGAVAARAERVADPCALPLPLALDEEGCRHLAAGEVVVSLRERPGAAIKEGIAVAVAEAPAERVFAVVTDAGAFAEFMPRVAESRLERGAGGELLNHQVIDLPLLSDRHYTVRLDHRAGEDEAGRFWRSAWTYVEGSGNIASSEGSWTVRPLGRGRSLVIYRVLTDPGGKLPGWAVNFATRRTLPELLKSVCRRAVEGTGEPDE